MEIEKKTYGVYDLVEWLVEIVMGGVRFRLNFSGGAVTTSGVTPATYTTEDPIVQLAVERSEHYLSGRIRLIRSTGTGREVKVGGCEAAEAAEVAEGEEGDDGEDGTDGLERIEVATAADAREWLRSHHGIATSRMRSKAIIAETGRSLGVLFVYPEGAAD